MRCTKPARLFGAVEYGKSFWLMASLVIFIASPGLEAHATGLALSGRVQLDGAGLSGVTMTLSRTGAADQVYTTSTDGSYQFTGIASANYTLTPSLAKHAFKPAQISYAPLAQSQTNQNFTASKAYTISGNVSLEGGDVTQVEMVLSGDASQTVYPDSTGAYAFTNLAAGGYVIKPKLTGAVFTPASKTYTDLAADQSGQDFVGDALHQITGKVAKDSAGLSGVVMTLKQTGAADRVYTTGQNGVYVFESLPTAEYTLAPAKASHVFTPEQRAYAPLLADQTDQNFEAQEVYSISGTVVLSDGGDVAQVALALTGDAARTVYPDASGAYVFEQLPAGNYTVTPTMAGCTFTPEQRCYEGLAASQTGQDFQGNNLHSITGHVLKDGAGLAGVTMTLRQTDGADQVYATTGEGVFVFNNVPTGDYTLTPSLENHSFTPELRSYAPLAQDELGQDFEAFATYAIRGIVSLTDGGDVAAAKVVLSGDKDAEVAPDEEGAYAFTDLEPGNYEVKAVLRGYRFEPELEQFAPLESDEEGVDFEGVRAYGVCVPFFQDNAPAEGRVPGSRGNQSFIGVKNLSGEPNTLTIHYTNQNGEDRTPEANTYVLNAYEGLSWRPCRQDANIEGVAAAIPDMTEEFIGSALVWSTGPVAGRMLFVSANGSESAYTLPGIEGSEQVVAPFFMDSSPTNGTVFPGTGMSTYLGVLNMDSSDMEAQLRVWYSNSASVDQTPEENCFTLGSWLGISWRPGKDDPNLEGHGAAVPNMMSGGVGSAVVTGGKYLAGRVLCMASTGAQYAYTMSGEGSEDLVVPFFMDNAPVEGKLIPSSGDATYIGVKNLSAEPVTLTIRYANISNLDVTPAVNTYVLAANGAVSWRPSKNAPLLEGVAVNVPDMAAGVGGSAVITATGPIAGRLLTIATNGSMSAYTLRSAEGAKTVVAPFFQDNAPADGAYPPVTNAASFIGIKNLTAEPVTLTIRYANGAGTDRTPANNTYVLAGNANISWRPTRNDPAVEGGAAAVPDMTLGGVGSAVIESTGPVAGRLLTVSSKSQSAYELPSSEE